MNDLTLKEKALTPDQIALVKRTVARGVSDDEFAMFIYLANKYDLDPFLKEICVVKRKVFNNYKKDWDEVISIMTTRDGFLTIAHKSGQFGGMESDAIYTDKGELDGAYCKVWNKSFTNPVTVKIKFKEYCVYTKEGKAQALWGSKPETMAKKVAESQALRKAFNIKGIYAEEEMEAEIKGSAKSELEYMGEAIKTTEALNDPDAYTKWAEVTTTAILDEIAVCETTQGLSQIKRKYEKEIGQMMDEDRAYALEMIDNRFQQLVSDSASPEGSMLKEGTKGFVIGDNAVSQGKKKPSQTPEEVLAAQEEYSKSFVKEFVLKVSDNHTKASLNVLKASAGFIDGRAKCLKEYRDYIDAVLKAKYEKVGVA